MGARGGGSGEREGGEGIREGLREDMEGSGNVSTGLSFWPLGVPKFEDL